MAAAIFVKITIMTVLGHNDAGRRFPAERLDTGRNAALPTAHQNPRSSINCRVLGPPIESLTLFMSRPSCICQTTPLS